MEHDRPDSPNSTDAHSFVSPSEETRPERDMTVVVENATQMASRGDLSVAIGMIQPFLRDPRTWKQAVLGMAQCYTIDHNFGLARSLLNEALKREPQDRTLLDLLDGLDEKQRLAVNAVRKPRIFIWLLIPALIAVGGCFHWGTLDGDPARLFKDIFGVEPTLHRTLYLVLTWASYGAAGLLALSLIIKSIARRVRIRGLQAVHSPGRKSISCPTCNLQIARGLAACPYCGLATTIELTPTVVVGSPSLDQIEASHPESTGSSISGSSEEAPSKVIAPEDSWTSGIPTPLKYATAFLAVVVAIYILLPAPTQEIEDSTVPDTGAIEESYNIAAEAMTLDPPQTSREGENHVDPLPLDSEPAPTKEERNNEALSTSSLVEKTLSARIPELHLPESESKLINDTKILLQNLWAIAHKYSLNKPAAMWITFIGSKEADDADKEYQYIMRTLYPAIQSQKEGFAENILKPILHRMEELSRLREADPSVKALEGRRYHLEIISRLSSDELLCKEPADLDTHYVVKGATPRPYQEFFIDMFRVAGQQSLENAFGVVSIVSVLVPVVESDQYTKAMNYLESEFKVINQWIKRQDLQIEMLLDLCNKASEFDIPITPSCLEVLWEKGSVSANFCLAGTTFAKEGNNSVGLIDNHGKLKWEVVLEEHSEEFKSNHLFALSNSGDVVFYGKGSILYALNTSNGSEKWFTLIPNSQMPAHSETVANLCLIYCVDSEFGNSGEFDPTQGLWYGFSGHGEVPLFAADRQPLIHEQWVLYSKKHYKMKAQEPVWAFKTNPWYGDIVLLNANTLKNQYEGKDNSLVYPLYVDDTGFWAFRPAGSPNLRPAGVDKFDLVFVEYSSGKESEVYPIGLKHSPIEFASIWHNLVYTTGDKELCCFNMDARKVTWSIAFSELAGPNADMEQLYGFRLEAEAVIAVFPQVVICIDPVSGKTLWRDQARLGRQGKIKDGILILDESGTRFCYGYDPAKGRIWKKEGSLHSFLPDGTLEEEDE